MPRPMNRPMPQRMALRPNGSLLQRPDASERVGRTSYLKPLLTTIAIVFLYTPLMSLGDYSLTIGTVCALLFITMTVFSQKGQFHFIGTLALAVLFPVLVYVLHIIFDTNYAIDFSRFFLSYALWSLSMIVIWAGFQDGAFMSVAWIYRTLVGLTILGLVQYVGASFFGIWWGYDLVAPFIGLDIYNSYLTLGVSEGVRAIGPYYEPSMFGRVIATLVAICLFHNYKIGTLLIILFINLLTTRSLGLVVLGGFTVLIYGAASARQLGIAAVALVAGYLAFGDFVASRVENKGDVGNNSTYIRMVIPFDAVSQILPTYPFGVPIGANAAVVEETLLGQYKNFREKKITNGVYEVVLYFGIIAIVVIIGLLIYTIMFAVSGKKAKATIALFILMSTAASSSYLSVESSLLNYILIAGVRAGDRRRKLEEGRSLFSGGQVTWQGGPPVIGTRG